MNLCEALESGKRYNRAIRLPHWKSGVYLYENELTKRMFLASPIVQGDNKPYDFSLECLVSEWSLSNEAPWYGPAGVITLERARSMGDCTDYNEAWQWYDCLH